MSELQPREAAFVAEHMSEIEDSETALPTAKKEAARVRRKLEASLTGQPE